jgi:hypothetical protein
MNPRMLFLVLPIFAAATFAPALLAQQSDSAAQNPQAAPAAKSAPAADSAPAKDSPATPPAPGKKVWTDEELHKMDPHAGVSTVGKEDHTNQGQRLGGNSARHDAKWYHDEITKMQGKVAELDKQIAELDAALSGHPTGDMKKSARPTGVKSDDWRDERDRLAAQREDLLAKISALQDQARHNGVSPNELP